MCLGFICASPPLKRLRETAIYASKYGFTSWGVGGARASIVTTYVRHVYDMYGKSRWLGDLDHVSRVQGHHIHRSLRP